MVSGRGYMVNNLMFADGIAGNEIQLLKTLVNGINKENTKMGMKININEQVYLLYNWPTMQQKTG